MDSEAFTLRRWRPAAPLSARVVLAVHRRGRGDPAYHVDDRGAVWRTTRTADGPATVRITVTAGPPRADRPVSADSADAPGSAHDRRGGPSGAGSASGGGEVEIAAWGPGAAAVLDEVPGWLGAHDDVSGFRPGHPVLAAVDRKARGLRIGRTGRVMEALVPAILEQKVTGEEARRSWRELLRRFGEPAPGPVPRGMRVVPEPGAWASIRVWEWHRAGVGPQRAQTIVRASSVAARVEECAALPAGQAGRRLGSIPGIGPWTVAETLQRSHGDPDAVSVGDYHLPSIVGAVLGDGPVDDAGMLALLEPWPGHRHRVARLCMLAGPRRERRGPRLPVRDYRAI